MSRPGSVRGAPGRTQNALPVKTAKKPPEPYTLFQFRANEMDWFFSPKGRKPASSAACGNCPVLW